MNFSFRFHMYFGVDSDVLKAADFMLYFPLNAVLFLQVSPQFGQKVSAGRPEHGR